MTSSSVQCVPYIKGKTQDLTTDEALDILQSVDENKCINIPPKYPKDGDIYIYKSNDESVSDGWKHDGQQWRIVSSVNIPRRNPTILKRTYTQLLPSGKEESGLKRHVYYELNDDNTEPSLTLLHYQGKSCIVDNESIKVKTPSISKSTPQSDIVITSTDNIVTITDDDDDDNDNDDDTNTNTTEIDSALATLETALQRKTDARPVMDVVSQLVKSATSNEERTDLDYCLVVSDKRSGKSSIISTPDLSSPRRSARKRSIKQVDIDDNKQDNNDGDKTVDKRPKLDNSSTIQLGDQEVLTAKGNVKKIPKPKKEQYFSFSIVSGEEKEIHSDMFEGRHDNNQKYLKIRNYMIQTWQKQRPTYLSISQIKDEIKDYEDKVISRLHKYLQCKGVINFNAEKSTKDSVDEQSDTNTKKSGPTGNKSKDKGLKKDVQTPDKNNDRKTKSKTKRADPVIEAPSKGDSIPESPGTRSSRRTRNVSTPNWADIISGRKSFKKDGGVFVVKKEPESEDEENPEPEFVTPKTKKQKITKKETIQRKSLESDEENLKEPETEVKSPQKVIVSKKIVDDKEIEGDDEITNKSSPRKLGPPKTFKSKSSAKNVTKDVKTVMDENDDDDDEDDDVKMETQESSYKSGSRLSYKFTCSECDRKFCVGYLLEEHMKKFHGKTVDGIDTGDDDVEDLDGDDDDDYAVEMKEMETQVDYDDSDLDSDVVEPPVRKVKKENQSAMDTDDKKPICLTCGQVFLTMANLKRHSLLHTNKMYECPFCAKIMKRKDYVNTHVRKVHKEIDIEKNPINFDDYTHVIPAEDVKVNKDVEVKETPNVEAGLGKKICPECNKLFDTSDELEDHMIVMHDKDLKDAVFTCQGCNKQFKTLVSYQVHKLSHRKKDHVCPHCGKTFVNNSQLQVHRRRDHQLQIGTLYYFGYVNNEDKICCEICSKDFDTMEEYIEHRPTHLIYDFLCTKCGNGFMEESELQKHIESDCSYLNLHLSCGVCNMKFSMYDTRRKHIMASHKKTTEFYCHHCGKCTETIDDLADHFNTHKVDRIFKCEICEKKFLEKRNLVDHRELHKSSKDWECHICKKSYLSSKSLQRHIKLHLSKTVKRCKHCNGSFNSVDELDAHIAAIHTDKVDETDIKCKVCSRTFLDHARMLKHMQIHDGKNTYACEVCNNEYDANFLPQWKHMKKEHPVEFEQTSKKIYYCDICDFSSPHKQRLERHNETHNKSKNFECQYCGRRYQTTSSLMTHMIVHRGKIKKGAKPQPVCTWPNCSKQFIKHSLYKRHLISHIFKVKMGKDLCECGNCQHSSLLAGQSYFVENEVDYTHVGYVDEDGNPLVATKLDPPPADARNKAMINLEVLARDGEKGYDTMEVLQEAIAKIEDIENKTQSDLEVKIVQSVTTSETVNETNDNVQDTAADAIEGEVHITEQENQNVDNSDINTEYTEIVNEDSLPTDSQTSTVTSTMDAGTQSVDESQDGQSNVVSQVEVLVDSIYECGVCDEMYPHKCQVLNHLETVHPNQAFPECPTCGKIIIDKKNLGDHMVIHEDSKKFQCDVCSKSFRTKQCLKQHSYIHATQKPYTCNFCGHGFTQKGFYLEHIRRHTGIKPFKCFVCQKAFVAKNLLRIHMFSHANSRPYKCDICPKSFSENYLLTAHMRTHNDDRPFGCTECDKSFYVKPKLLRHLNAVHGIAKELLTNFVPTRVGDGIGYRNRNKLKQDDDRDTETTVVYINSEGQIVRQGTENRGRNQQGNVTMNRPIKIKPSSTFTSISAQSIATADKDIEEDIQSFQVVTKRDEHGSVQVNPVMQTEMYTTDGERIELNGQNYTLVTDDTEGGEGHITLITQAEFDGTEVEGHPDQGQGEIQVITQEVTEGEVIHSNDDLRVISQADITQSMEDGEKFSINIGEDGTVDMADFDKIEALRNIYGDQQIVIVVESQQQDV